MELIKANKRGLQFILLILIASLIWVSPQPEGVDPKAWHLFAIFVATILGVILKPLPMGAVSLLALTVTILFKILSFKEAFSGFSNSIVWLVVLAFFIAKGFITTGLGHRLAYFFMSWLGRTSLGLSYGIVASDLLLAPAIPSVTARIGGIVYPIVLSLSSAFNSNPFDASSRKLGAYLTVCAFQGAMISSAMFLTSMAGNPLIAELGLKNTGITITWASWATAAIVPGLISLIIMPYLVYKIYPPSIKTTPHAREFAKTKLQAMGKLSSKEYIMFATFLMLITLWIFGGALGIEATLTALIGFSILLLTGVLDWKESLKEEGAWDTLIWFATLVTLAGYLYEFGFIPWFSESIVQYVAKFHWIIAFLILSFVYFYSHYFFASNVAHISAMFAPFVVIAIALGAPAELAILCLAFFSSLFGGLTHYGSGPAPILYGAGYVSILDWWKLGLVVSFLNIAVFVVIGGAWWKLLGLW